MLLTACLRLADRRRKPVRPPSQRTVILLHHAYGTGGTVRTVLTYARHLAAQRDVELVSVVRERQSSFFTIPDGVGVTFLDDRMEPPRGLRGAARRHLSRVPSLLVPQNEPSYKRCSLWTDVLLVRYLRSLQGGVLITTRPSLNLAAAMCAPAGVVTIGQEHMNLGTHRGALRAQILRWYGRLDAVVTLTPSDMEGYRCALPKQIHAPHAPHLDFIPNALPALKGGPADQRAKTVMAAGRLVKQKGFDLLLAAWQEVAAAHPDWTLRIYGTGRLQTRLETQIRELGLATTVSLMGAAGDIGTEMSKASILALSSRYEGLPMILIEGMSKGLAVAAFDCPTGPREIITDGADGLLVEPENAAALAGAIGRLIEDDDLRRRLGAQAVLTAAARYDLTGIGARWDALFDELATAGRRTP
ncbi:glycosyltransferase family 4 protein [Actinomadura barringtoniae]|uniref:Glycosyltransferase family 4 protein n=2 Tax=Actinomadura barringtoniae TaxID=1427535 RepID=A0A939P6E0_9ACTN|nr:glycosyltransferase family 4 protein [Actinomadura barringtoniae]